MNYFIAATRSELRELKSILEDIDSGLEIFGRDHKADEQIEIRLSNDKNVSITLMDTDWDDLHKSKK